MPKHHWHILGAGAIGCLYAQALQAGGADVTLVLRSGSAPSKQLIVESNSPRAQRLELPMAGIAADHCAGISHLVICTKAYDATSAVEAIAHALLPNAAVVLLVNGMGVLERLQQAHPQREFYCATTTAGAYTLGPQHIFHAGEGETRLGRQGQLDIPAWFEPWSSGVTNCSWEADIEAALWHKLAVNAVINPLTALHGCRNGELAQRADLQDQVNRLCQEASQISYAAGFTHTAQTLSSAVQQVIARTADNRSSMLQDVEAGRRTEIDFITGYLLQVAAVHGIPAATHQDLFGQLTKHQ